jgi:hypothetical protein
VEVDIHEGLPEVMDIEWQGRHTKQRLDYQGIPFRCSWCHCTGHLRRDCSGKVVEEKSEDTLLQEDPLDYMDEEDSMGDAPFHSAAETDLPSDPVNTLLGKLKLFFPSLFSSLSMWEKEALENSGWLLRSTSGSKGAFEGGLGFVGPVKESLIPLLKWVSHPT